MKKPNRLLSWLLAINLAVCEFPEIISKNINIFLGISEQNWLPSKKRWCVLLLILLKATCYSIPCLVQIDKLSISRFQLNQLQTFKIRLTFDQQRQKKITITTVSIILLDFNSFTIANFHTDLSHLIIWCIMSRAAEVTSSFDSW